MAKPHYDALVIGAGFAGLRMVHELRKLGLTFKVLEEATGVGGTWYWNRYPGARTDSESWIYILNFSKELNDEWTWKERFPRQPEVLEYLNYVADKFDMRKDIQFKTRVLSAIWDNARSLWTIRTMADESLTCKYFISATGVLSVGRDLPFPGTEKFKGESYLTYKWPHHNVEFKGKRVAVIGTGATSVQIIPIVAHSAKELVVFQRTANFVLPARNHPLTSEQHDEIKRNYDAIWEGARTETFGMSMVDSKMRTTDMPNEEAVQRVFEAGWESGGFRFIFETFTDMLTSQQANDTGSEFVRNKIRSIVKDEETAELLCPDHPIMAKRPPLGHHYFETFNKPNVTLVDIKKNPVKEITESGVALSTKDPRTGKDAFDFDIIIYAVGFDASTGPLTRLEVRGKEDQTLGDHWSKSVDTYLGICVEHYPNMFMLSAPQSPFANLPIVLDNSADWIGKCIAYIQKNGYKQMEPKPAAQEKWRKELYDVFDATVLPEAAKKAGSWYVGANIPGKHVNPLFWFGGVVSYFEICDAEIDSDFKSLKFSGQASDDRSIATRDIRANL